MATTRVTIWLSQDENGFYAEVEDLERYEDLYATTWFTTEDAAIAEATRWAKANRCEVIDHHDHH